MQKKIIAHHVLYYRELGEAPKLRRVNAQAKGNRDKQRLSIACEYLNSLLGNPVLVENYYRKLAR